MIAYQLPLPPSTNRIWRKSRNRVHRSAEYVSWVRGADSNLMAQGLRQHAGPANIRIVISNTARGDIDNRCKAVLDFLVHHGIIEDDSKRIVRKILMEWGPIDGCRVEITAAAEWTARKIKQRKAA